MTGHRICPGWQAGHRISPGHRIGPGLRIGPEWQAGHRISPGHRIGPGWQGTLPSRVSGHRIGQCLGHLHTFHTELLLKRCPPCEILPHPSSCVLYVMHSLPISELSRISRGVSLSPVPEGARIKDMSLCGCLYVFGGSTTLDTGVWAHASSPVYTQGSFFCLKTDYEGKEPPLGLRTVC